MTKRALLCATVLLSVPAMVGAAQRTYVKEAPVQAATMNSDLDACVQQVLAYMNGPNSPVPRLHNPTTDQSIAHAFDMRGSRAAAAAETKCIAEKGYVPLPLSKDETKALSHARGMPARDRWYDAFVASDLSERIKAAQANATATPS